MTTQIDEVHQVIIGEQEILLVNERRWRHIVFQITEMIGRKYGKLTVIGYGGKTANHHTKWNCICDCGGTCAPQTTHLLTGRVQACGCTRIRHGAARRITGSSVEYQAWTDAKARCSNPVHKSFYLYGERGIRMCEEWAVDFGAFLKYVGPKPDPSLTLERIDNNKGYEPGNVCWATWHEQRINQRRPYYGNS